MISHEYCPFDQPGNTEGSECNRFSCQYQVVPVVHPIPGGKPSEFSCRQDEQTNKNEYTTTAINVIAPDFLRSGYLIGMGSGEEKETKKSKDKKKKQSRSIMQKRYRRIRLKQYKITGGTMRTVAAGRTKCNDAGTDSG